MIPSALTYVVGAAYHGERLFVDMDPDVGIPLWLHRLQFKPPINHYQIEVAKRCMVFEVWDELGRCDCRILKGTLREGRSKWNHRFYPPAAMPRDGVADGLYWYRVWTGRTVPGTKVQPK